MATIVYTKSTDKRPKSSGRVTGLLLKNLRKRLASGWIAPQEFLPSIRAISEEQSVACKTVHRVLRLLADEGLLVAEPQQGFRVLPKALNPDRAAPVALLFGETATARTSLDQKVVNMLRHSAGVRGRAVLVMESVGVSPEAVMDQLQAAGVWGVVLDSVASPLIDRLLGSRLPAVMVDGWAEGIELDSVVQDSFRGALQAASYLVAQKHERVAWLGTTPENGAPQTVERFAGAVGGLARSGKRFLPGMVPRIPSNTPQNYLDGARRLLSLPDRPTAILALWQAAVEAVVQAARERNLVVGRDFEMVGWVTEEGYDHSYRPLFADAPPPPAITWSVESMAEAAIARLEERRAHPDMQAVQIRVTTKLKVSV